MWGQGTHGGGTQPLTAYPRKTEKQTCKGDHVGEDGGQHDPSTDHKEEQEMEGTGSLVTGWSLVERVV